MKRHGIALVVVLLSITLVGAICTIMFSRTVSEIKHSSMNASIAQTLMMARGAANAGGSMLSGPIKDKLLSVVVSYFNPSGPWAFGSSANLGDAQPTPTSVASDFNDVVTSLQDNVNDALCDLNLPSEQGATITLRVFFKPADITVCEQTVSYPTAIPMPKPRYVSGGPRGGNGDKSGQVYAVPFVMVAEANLGPYRRNIVLQGEYEFDATVSSFARFALFTNKHQAPDGTSIWFTDRTRFEGPVHTNQNFRFFRNPYFGGYVSSAGCTNPGPDSCLGTYNRGGIFYGVNNNNIIKNPKPPYSNANPQFTKTVDWNASYIALPLEAINMQAQATRSGMMIEGNLANLTLFAGDDAGNPLIPGTGNTWTIPGPTPGPATFQYVRACSDALNCNVFRYGENKLLFRQNGAGWDPVMNTATPAAQVEFNGMLYVNGNIANMGGPARTNVTDPATAPPALAEFANLTVANAGVGNHINIRGDLKYEKVPCPEAIAGSTNPCQNMEARNVLGVYSQEGDITIGDGTNSSLQDLTIQGVLMTSRGTVTVQNYQTITPRGGVKLLGGIIENTYGGFGTFNTSTGTATSGYGRDFVYDRRMASGVSPPYFPGTNVSNNGARVQSFGQREQVY